MIVCSFAETGGELFDQAARVAIQGLCDAVEPEVRGLLPSFATAIRLSIAAGLAVIPETGDAATPATPDSISWTLAPDRPGGVLGVARARLRPTLFHELHHLARGWVVRGGPPPASLMDAVVSEGLATAFERDAAGSDPPWGRYVAEEALPWAEELLALPPAALASYRQWMFQHPDGRRWIGYRAGTCIVDRAIAASGRSAAALATTPTAEILDLAGLRLT